MGQIEDLRLFVTVVDEGSIARAADRIGIAKSAVSRRLSQLEDRYDVRLIDRQPRNWEVTNAGLELYQRANSIVTDADDLDSDFMHTSVSLSGPLRVTMAREFGMTFLRPALYAFIQAHPEIDLTIDFDDRTVDLESENYDLAIRITSDDLTGLSSKKLGATRHGMFASAAYIKAHGQPVDPKELGHHALLHYGPERRANWVFGHQGKRQIVTFLPALNSNYGSFLLDAGLNGLGILRLPDFIVADAIDAGKLVQILPESDFPEFGIYLVHSANRRINKRMRRFISAIEQSCAILGR